MTRVELQYKIVNPFSDADYERLSNLTSVYGVMGIHLNSDASAVMVEYDATRLNPDGVDHVLKSTGLPVARTI